MKYEMNQLMWYITRVGDCASACVQTGTNLMNVMVHKKKEVTVRELGGSMGPIWKNYYSNASAILVGTVCVYVCVCVCVHMWLYISLFICACV